MTGKGTRMCDCRGYRARCCITLSNVACFGDSRKRRQSACGPSQSHPETVKSPSSSQGCSEQAVSRDLITSDSAGIENSKRKSPACRAGCMCRSLYRLDRRCRDRSADRNSDVTTKAPAVTRSIVDGTRPWLCDCRQTDNLDSFMLLYCTTSKCRLCCSSILCSLCICQASSSSARRIRLFQPPHPAAGGIRNRRLCMSLFLV